MRALLSWWGALGFGLLAQSTLLPHLLSDPWRPDISLILVLWAALTGTPRGGAFLGFAAGLALDASSGAPLGFSASARLLLYALCRPFRGVFFDDHPLLLLPFAALATLVDALGVWAMSALFLTKTVPFASVASTAWRQALAEAVAVPVVFVLLETVSGRRPPKLKPPAREVLA